MPMPRTQGALRAAAVFCLCALFAVLAMGLTLLSSGVYRSTVEDADRNFTHRTALSYLVNQVRRADTVGGVSIGTFGDGDALALTEDLGGAVYVTLLYCYDGQLRELYMEAGTGLSPEDGIAILPMESMELGERDGLLEIAVTDAAGERFLTSLSPRTGLGEGGAL